MDKTSFLERLFAMFPMNFNENNIPFWIEAYETAFGSSRIDYNKLFQFMIAEHSNMSSAPSPKWFRDNKASCVIKDDTCAAIQHLEEIKNDPLNIPMPEDFKIKMEALKQKLSMG